MKNLANIINSGVLLLAFSACGSQSADEAKSGAGQSLVNSKTIFKTGQKLSFKVDMSNGYYEDESDKTKALKSDGYYQAGIDKKAHTLKDGDVYDPNTELTWKISSIKSVQLQYDMSKNDKIACGDYGDDWRLPSIFEFLSILDFEYKKDPNSANKLGFMKHFNKLPKDKDYWMNAYDFSQDSENDGEYFITFSASHSFSFDVNPRDENYALCVQGKKQENFKTDFVRDDAKEVVVDKLNALMWDDSAALAASKEKGGSSDGLKYFEAIDACENSTHAGYDDWRLPNIYELYSIFKRPSKQVRVSDKEPLNEAFKSLKSVGDVSSQARYASGTIRDKMDFSPNTPSVDAERVIWGMSIDGNVAFQKK